MYYFEVLFYDYNLYKQERLPVVPACTLKKASTKVGCSAREHIIIDTQPPPSKQRNSIPCDERTMNERWLLNCVVN